MLFLIFSLIISLLILTLIWYSTSPPTGSVYKPSNIPYKDRDYIEYTDLFDPNIRANPHSFNQHIYNNIISKSKEKSIQNGIIPVRGEKNTFLICKYKQIKEILSNEQVFSSNPFPDDRLIAPNTMNDKEHKIIMKYLAKYYSAFTISKQTESIQNIIDGITKNFIHLQRTQNTQTTGVDAMKHFCNLIVMKTELFMMGLPSNQYNDQQLINNLILMNDQMVQLVAPQGGIGYKISFSFKQCVKVIIGLLFASIPTIRLMLKIGIINCWQIMRPDLNIFNLPNIERDDGLPRTQIWIYPHLLAAVPKYFLFLNELYETYGVGMKCPNMSKETNVIDGKNILQSLHDAEMKGDMTRCQILVTLVQLMVNMTTANAIGNMLYRMSTMEKFCDGRRNELIEEVLRFDASLQRLPRRCRLRVDDFYGAEFEANTTLICMIGLGNCDQEIFGESAFAFDENRYCLNKTVAKSLSFGYGIHRCLGYMLVKREMNLTLTALAKHNVKRIVYKSSERVTDIDVGNYGFKRLFLQFDK